MPKPGTTREDNGPKIKFVWCPPGRFVMGTEIVDRANQDRQSIEGPVEVVLTHGLWMSQSEITQSAWKRVMGTTPWDGRPNVVVGDNYPATFVSWNRALAFCGEFTRLERIAGRLPMDLEYSLPTEAEWEYACRAGTKTKYSFGNDETELGKHAWYSVNTRHQRFAHPVSSRLPNAWGFVDMHGNVREWCLDAFSETLPGGDDPVIRTGTEGGDSRIVRGGGWMATYYYSAARNVSGLSSANAYTGFRPVCVRCREIKWSEADLAVEDEFDDQQW
jgi:formylglycine-generating enzyme required for sulfatase activity